ncbi:MAG: hypothetical protein FJW61_03060 [Actinobacteria bacterium]|nr:hypothetical protein [Actinomycetota bacterium]
MRINKNEIKKYFSDKTNLALFIILLIVCVYAAVVRFKNIGVLAYWGDDGQTFLGTLSILEHGLPRLPSGNVMYHTFFHFYLRVIPSLIFGLNEVSLRFPSAFFGVLIIPLIYLFVKDLINRYAAILAAIITSFNAWQIEFSREVRYYSEFQFFYLLSTYLFYRGYFREENKFKIPALISIFITTIIQQLGLTLIFLFIMLFIYKRFKGFFKKNIIISFIIVIIIVAGQVIHRELFWKAGLGFYTVNIDTNITNPVLKILSKFFTPYVPYYYRIYGEIFPQMYIAVFWGAVLIALYLFLPWLRSKEEDFISIYSGKKYSIKLPFNLAFLYFMFFSNTVFNGFGYMNTQQRYIYHAHTFFIAIFCYVVFDISRLLSLSVNRINVKKISLIKSAIYFTSVALILFFTLNWVNPVANFKIIFRKNGDEVNSIFAPSSTFTFHHDPKKPGLYIYNNKKEGDLVIATDLLNPCGYTRQIDYWLWTGGFPTWQPYIYKDGKMYDEFYGVPIIRDIYQFYKVLNDNSEKNIWLITSNSIRVPNHISPDVADFINSQKQYLKVTGDDGICSAYLFPGLYEGTRQFFFIPESENIIEVTSENLPLVIGFGNKNNQPYFKYGWSNIEPQLGTWSDKLYSVLFLNFKEKKTYRIIINVSSLYSNEQQQEMKILFNNEKIGEIKFENSEPGEYQFIIEKDLIKLDNYNVLEFNYKYLLSPLALGVSSDSRNLSVFFRRIKLEED